MAAHWIMRGTLGVAAAALLVIAPADAFASKERFVRDKPHVNIGTIGNQSSTENQEEEKEEAGTKVRKPMQDLKKSHGDEPGTLKGQVKGAKKDAKERAKEVAKNRSKDDEDVASKTDKSDAARAKRKH